MLNGKDPVIIFQFSKLAGTSFGNFLADFPLLSAIPQAIEMPPIPIYLSQRYTGLQIDSEDKNIDIVTDYETRSDGMEHLTSQKGLTSTVTVTLIANKRAAGVSLLSAMIDNIFDKVTSKEYSISYLHGATTIFRGLVESYSVNQNASNELLTIQLVLSKGKKQPTKKESVPTVEGIDGIDPLQRGA